MAIDRSSPLYLFWYVDAGDRPVLVAVDTDAVRTRTVTIVGVRLVGARPTRTCTLVIAGAEAPRHPAIVGADADRETPDPPPTRGGSPNERQQV